MKNIIFDWSGVVKDAFVSHLWVVNRILRKYGIEEMTKDQLKKVWIEPYMNFYNRYIPDLTLEEQQKLYMEGVMDKNYPQSNAYPGIVELICELKNKDFYLAVVSGDFNETIFPEMKKFGLENIFDDVITQVHHKDESIQSLIDKNKLDLNTTFIVGDSINEIIFGKKTGINTVAVTWGFTTEENL
jgi:phosphoglycolate phosphatase